MQRPWLLNNTTVRKSPIHGYGVFANQTFQADEVIEECYALTSQEKQTAAHFDYYYFIVDAQDLLLLGNGSIYNHSDHPNAVFEFDPNTRTMFFRATTTIRSGEEIFISYGEHWFSSRQARAKAFTWRYTLWRLKPLVAKVLRVSVVMLALMGFAHYLPLVLNI
jgi:SET domain-containing protein